MLAFGFPAGFNGLGPPTGNLTNHASALRNPNQVAAFLEKGCRLGAMLGPLPVPPFVSWSRNNPLMTRPKRNSSDLRVILDLSFPLGTSVNSSIPKDSLDGARFKLKLPSPMDLANLMRSIGPGCHLYKVDLSHAYRQLRSDPLDWPLLGVDWDGQHFVDTAIPFGLRHGASACQRTSEAAATVASHKCGAKTEAYIDDTAGAALPTVSQSHYRGLVSTMDELGLETTPEKCTPPSTRMLWVGVWYDSVAQTMAIDRDRIQEALAECEKFVGASRVTLHALQKFLGRLYHASKCTLSARAFMARLLDLLRKAVHEQFVHVTEEAKADAYWFLAFLDKFNGVTVLKPLQPSFEANVDSCLRGSGGICDGLGFYTVAYPEHMVQLELSIASWECFNLLLAVRLWVRQWAGSHVAINCDNWATVCSIGSSKANDPLIRSALRELWWLTAIWDVQLSVFHKLGVEMEVADLLSRAPLSDSHYKKFVDFCGTTSEIQRHITPQLLMPPLCL